MVGQPNATGTELRVDPQFVHRELAAQVFGAADPLLSRLSDQVMEVVRRGAVEDLRVACLSGSLSELEGRPVMIRAGVYFRSSGDGNLQRYGFRASIKVDDGVSLSIDGEFDPSRFETNSATTNLRNQVHVVVVGVALSAATSTNQVTIRPILIGYPFVTPAGGIDNVAIRSSRAEIWCRDVDQFGLQEADLSIPVSTSDLDRLFRMPETEVKSAFAQILGITHAPKDWGGENSDLVARVTIRGAPARAAFAFKGPGGKPKPWNLHPSGMGKNGDQAIRLYAEPADICVVQHCSYIAESVHHLMDALSARHNRAYMLIDGATTVRILKQADLLAYS